MVMQDVFNLLPNLSVDELLTSFAVKSNDMMLAVYLASMIRRYAQLHLLYIQFGKMLAVSLHALEQHAPICWDIYIV